MNDNNIRKLADTILDVVEGKLKKKPQAYDTQAVVRRVDAQTGTAYVHIPNGVDETPVRLTIDAEAGDTVQVRVADGRAWLTGNRTAPPTDDAEALVAKAVAAVADKNAAVASNKAEKAQETAEAVSGIAASAMTEAQAAKTIADNTEQHFWFTSTGTDTGAHITEVTQEEFTDPSDPNYQSGGNLLARTNGIAVRDGMTELASFGASGATIGENANGESRTEIGTSGMQVIHNVNGTDLPIANLGYGPGADSGGGTDSKPYFTFGVRSGAVGNYSVAEGMQTVASAYTSHAEGWTSEATGTGSHAEGLYTTAGGEYSHAEGYYGTANGYAAHVEGYETEAVGNYGHAEGWKGKASAVYAHAEGYTATASDEAAHAEGSNTTASAKYSHAEGAQTTASGEAAHAEGSSATASGKSSHAGGTGTTAQRLSQTVVGEYNKLDTSGTTTTRGDYAFIVGNGSSSSSRSNALGVKWDGSIIVGDHTTAIGAIPTAARNTSTVTVNTSTATDICSLSLPKGVWVVCCGLRWPANTTGYRAGKLHSTSAGITVANADVVTFAQNMSGTAYQMQWTKIINETRTSGTWYLEALQNSGSTLTMPTGSTQNYTNPYGSYIHAVRIA